jgi:hypothetical protein
MAVSFNFFPSCADLKNAFSAFCWNIYTCIWRSRIVSRVVCSLDSKELQDTPTKIQEIFQKCGFEGTSLSGSKLNTISEAIRKRKRDETDQIFENYAKKLKRDGITIPIREHFEPTPSHLSHGAPVFSRRQLNEILHPWPAMEEERRIREQVSSSFGLPSGVMHTTPTARGYTRTYIPSSESSKTPSSTQRKPFKNILISEQLPHATGDYHIEIASNDSFVPVQTKLKIDQWIETLRQYPKILMRRQVGAPGLERACEEKLSRAIEKFRKMHPTLQIIRRDPSRTQMGESISYSIQRELGNEFDVNFSKLIPFVLGRKAKAEAQIVEGSEWTKDEKKAVRELVGHLKKCYRLSNAFESRQSLERAEELNRAIDSINAALEKCRTGVLKGFAIDGFAIPKKIEMAQADPK